MSRCKCDWSAEHTTDAFRRITPITHDEETQIDGMFRTYLIFDVHDRRTKSIYCTSCRQTGDFVKPSKFDLGYDPYNDFADYYNMKHGDQTHCPFCGNSAEVFGRLDQSQMVAMFSLEPEKRMELMDQTEGIEDMSSRQIADLVKQKKLAEKEAERERKARERADKIAIEQADKASKLETEAGKHQQQVKDLEDELERIRMELDTEKAQASIVPPDTSEKDKRIEELLAEIAELKQKNDPEKGLELIREQVRREMQNDLEAADNRAAAAEKKLESAKNPAVQRISFLFSEAQDLVKRTCAELDALEETEPEKAEKLRGAISKALRDMGDFVKGA